jgi:hypothetical protein
MGYMGEKQIRAHADKAAAEVLGPLFAALSDLAVAAAEANQEEALRAAAKAKAQQILEAAEAEIVARRERWWLAWQAARQAGWTPNKLRSDPIGQRRPPASYRPKHAHGSVRVSGSGDRGERDKAAVGVGSVGDPSSL